MTNDEHRWARGGGVGGAPQGKKLFEVDTQGEKGRHPHLDTPKVKKNWAN